MGDVLYLGPTGNSSNDQQSALLLTKTKVFNLVVGIITVKKWHKWLTVENDRTVLYRCN